MRAWAAWKAAAGRGRALHGCMLLAMAEKLTRRDAALLIAAGSAATAQNTQAPATPNQDVSATVAERRREAAAKMAHFKLPMATEPAFQFRA